jgi:hypothetical protein
MSLRNICEVILYKISESKCSTNLRNIAWFFLGGRVVAFDRLKDLGSATACYCAAPRHVPGTFVRELENFPNSPFDARPNMGQFRQDPTASKLALCRSQGLC